MQRDHVCCQCTEPKTQGQGNDGWMNYCVLDVTNKCSVDTKIFHLDSDAVCARDCASVCVVTLICTEHCTPSNTHF